MKPGEFRVRMLRIVPRGGIGMRAAPSQLPRMFEVSA
jgi:hypothetical protein